MSDDKKDYILNLRISRATYEKLKERASDNRETLSNLARKVIDDGLEIIGDFSDELLGKDKNAQKNIAFYYEAKLVQSAQCHACKSALKKDANVTIGEAKSGRKYYYCTKCKP